MFFGLISCAYETSETTDFVGEVEVLDSLTFYIDEDTVFPLKSAGCYQFLPEENQLVFLNTYPGRPDLEELQSIRFFNFDTGQEVDSIVLDKRGGHGFVLTPTNFYYQSSDSIWVYPARVRIDWRTEGLNYHEIGLVNSGGQVEMRPSLVPGAIRAGMAVPMSKGHGAIVRRGRELIVSSLVSWKSGRLASPFYTLDIKNARAGVIDFRPYRDIQPSKSIRSRLNAFKKFSEVRSVINAREELVSCFPLDHLLSIIDKNGDVEKVLVKSRYLEALPELEDKPVSSEALTKVLNTAGYYVGLLYDADRDYYYRLVKLPKSNEKDADMYTIMVVNSRFELMAESAFNGDTYLFEKGVFVAKGGLFVLSNPKSNGEMTFVKLGLREGL
ncbi:MAG: hypothetical protein Roseis3KO_51240 [Roseivirga sp.]